MGASSSYIVSGSSWEKYATVTYQDVAVAGTRETVSIPVPSGVTINNLYYTVTQAFDDGLGSPVSMELTLSGALMTGVPLSIDISDVASKAFVLGPTKSIPITGPNDVLEVTINSQLVSLDTLTSGEVEVYLMTAKL